MHARQCTSSSCAPDRRGTPRTGGCASRCTLSSPSMRGTAQWQPRCGSWITPKSSSSGSSLSGYSSEKGNTADGSEWSRPVAFRHAHQRLCHWLLAARPVTSVLIKKRQRLKRLHAVEEKHTVQMIGFVLDDAGG